MRKGIARVTLNTPELPGSNFSGQEYFIKASSPIDDKPVLEFIDLPGVHRNGEYGVVIAMPIYSDEDEFGGVILFFLKLHDLIEDHSLAANSNTRNWIVDQHSNIIYYCLTFLVIFYMLQLR